MPPPHGATTLGTGTRQGAWGSAWPKLWAEPLSACPPGRRELHPLSTVPSCRQGLQCKELEPDQMQPEHTNTYGEVPRAFPRKRLLWKRRWRGPADLAGRRQWDCGGPCTSTSSPRLPGSASRACRQGTSFANPATALSFAPFLLPGCACLLPADRAWGGCPAGSQQQRVHPQHSPSLAGTTALGPAAPGLAWEQGYGENTTGPSSPHQSRAIARTSSGALTHRSANSLQQGPGPGFAQWGLHDPYGRKQTLHYGGDPTASWGSPSSSSTIPASMGRLLLPGGCCGRRGTAGTARPRTGTAAPCSRRGEKPCV